MTPHLVVSDLTARVHTTEEPITKDVAAQVANTYGGDLIEGWTGSVPVEVGDTVTLALSAECALGSDVCSDPAHRRSVRVEWVGPPARVIQCSVPYCEHVHKYSSYDGIVLGKPNYDELGIADLPDDATVYLFGETT